MNAEKLALLRWRDHSKVRRDYEKALETAALVGPAKEYPFAYYSLLRPLDVWFPVVKSAECAVGNFLFAARPIPLEKALQFTLVPYLPGTWVEMAIQIYTEEFGKDTLMWCFEKDGPAGEQMAFYKVSDDKWMVVFFNENGIRQTTVLPAMKACLNRAYIDEFWIPKPPNTWDRYREMWDANGITRVNPEATANEGPDMTTHADRLYRERFSFYAKVGDSLVPHGWEQKHANTWRKKVGRKVATIICEDDGEINGRGYLPLLAEAHQILTADGLLPAAK